jgi:cytochrome c553
MIYGDMPSRAQTSKAKNDQRTRVERLMDNLSPDEISELEYYYANERGQEDADPIQLETLMRQGKSS